MNQALGFEPVERDTDYLAGITKEACQLVSAGKVGFMAVHKYKDIPIAKASDPKAPQAVLDEAVGRILWSIVQHANVSERIYKLSVS